MIIFLLICILVVLSVLTYIIFRFIVWYKCAYTSKSGLDAIWGDFYE